VEPFGSFASNLFTRWADLDISIDLLNSSCISSAGKRRKQRLLGDIQKALRTIGKFLWVQVFYFCLSLECLFSILPHY
jgi:hypothetical protein